MAEPLSADPLGCLHILATCIVTLPCALVGGTIVYQATGGSGSDNNGAYAWSAIGFAVAGALVYFILVDAFFMALRRSAAGDARFKSEHARILRKSAKKPEKTGPLTREKSF